MIPIRKSPSKRCCVLEGAATIGWYHHERQPDERQGDHQERAKDAVELDHFKKLAQYLKLGNGAGDTKDAEIRAAFTKESRPKSM